jgi:hypothetical protein
MQAMVNVTAGAAPADDVGAHCDFLEALQQVSY